MNRPAIHDLLDTLLSTWYHKAAAWAPPGRLSSETCTLCHTSTVAEVIDIAEWPHDLIHDLVTAIDRAIIEISESFSDECPETPVDDARVLCAFTAVRTKLADHADDLVDVLTECVEPKLTHYVYWQSDLVMGKVGAWSEEFPSR